MKVPLGEWAAWENVSTGAPQSLVCGCPAQNFRLTRRCLSPQPLSSLSMQVIWPVPCLIGIPQVCLYDHVKIKK